MSNWTRYLPSFMILLWAGTNTAATLPWVQVSPPCIVRGRIEILNPKVKMRGGGADASGVVVWLTPLREAPKPDSFSPQKRTLVQRDKRFIPHIMAIQVGTEVEFPNFDPFFHNVFSVFDGKRFDLGLYANGESKLVRFNRPGISFIYCNIHPQMSAVIVTLETPYFAVSVSDGTYRIMDVPPGIYRLRLWHERSNENQLASQSRTVSVGPEVAQLSVIQLDEAGYIPRAHKNKYGEEYTGVRGVPPYSRPQ